MSQNHRRPEPGVYHRNTVLPHVLVLLLAAVLIGIAQQNEATTRPSENVPTAEPPRFTWSPRQGYVFLEGNCGTDDQTLGWMSPIDPTRLREAKLIMFTRGADWQAKFEEVKEHFIARWTALKGQEVVVVPGDHGRLRDDPIRVRLPEETPFEVGTFQEAMYLQGFSGGYMDQENLRHSASAPVGGARGAGWRAGWAAANHSRQGEGPPP